MAEIEKNVRQQLLPSITGKNHLTDEDRRFFALPLRMGGIDLLSNTDFSKNYEWLRAICDPLENSDTEIAETEQTLINRNIKLRNRTSHSEKRLKTYGKLLIREKTDNKSSVTERSIELAKRAPPNKYTFSLNRSEFKDGLHLRYGWEPPNTPHTCPCGCEQPFTLTHFLHCPKGGYTHLRHNEIRDTLATLLDEVCHDVEIEPKLQSLEGESFHNKTTNTEYDARLDI